MYLERLGEFVEEYQGFIKGDQLHREAEKFLSSVEFASSVGDPAITALSDVLKTPIVLLTSVENMPVYIQHPTHCQTLNMNPIFLAYNQFGAESALQSHKTSKSKVVAVEGSQ